MSRTRKTGIPESGQGVQDRSKRSYRRLARAGVALVVAVGLTVAAVLLLTPFRQNQAMAIEDNCADPPPVPGPARPWESEIQVSTYSSANTRSGNLLTVIPIIGWSGLGPDMNMVLYHNAASVTKPAGWTNNVGFNLGPGWTIAYSDQLKLDLTNNKVTVVYDDGTDDLYTWSGTAWVPPDGVFSTLERDTQNQDLWRVRHKDQSYYEFDSLGTAVARLKAIFDATGNTLTVTYLNNRVERITAAGRPLIFEYNTLGQLWKFFDPSDGSSTIADRTWTLSYDDDRLEQVKDPLDPTPAIRLTYDADGRIETISDKVLPEGDADIYEYTYYGSGSLLAPGRIHTVTDPDDPGSSEDGFVQEFETICAYEDFYTIYHDRRGSSWKYYYYRPTNLNEDYDLYPDGNLMAIVAPGISITEGVSIGYYEERLMWWTTGGAAQVWEATYDDNGNLLTRTDMLDQTETWTYDSYNNVTSYTDRADKETTFGYHPTYHTLLTSIVEPPDGQPGSGEAITTLDYYLDTQEDEDRFGLLKRVEDPNEVVTTFDYDGFGQPALYTEGEVGGGPIYCETSNYDSGSRMTDASYVCPSQVAGGGFRGGFALYNALNQLTGTGCGAQSRGPGFTVDDLPEGFPPIPCNVNEPSPLKASISGILYTPKGEIAELPMELDAWNNGLEGRVFTFDYDNLGRQTLADKESNESGSTQNRPFLYDYHINPANGDMWVDREGPDGVVTRYVYDRQYRLDTITRDTANPIMEAEFTYYATGLVQGIEYANGDGALILYEYDEANRVTAIEHQDNDEELFLRLEYEYKEDTDLPETIKEYDGSGLIATTTYQYDDRGRLISDNRTPEGYGLYLYTYDDGGNRQTMTDSGEDLAVDYEYDYEDVEKYGTANNRLMMETVTNTSTLQVISKYYFYNDVGNVEWIVTGPPDSGSQSLMVGGGEEMLSSEPPAEQSPGAEPLASASADASTPSLFQGEGWGEGGDDGGMQAAAGGGGPTCTFPESQYTATRFVYGENGRTVNYISNEQWCWNAANTCPRTNSYVVNTATEYRYDSPRQRYYQLGLNPGQFKLGTVSGDPEDVEWFDFEDGEVYGQHWYSSGDPQEVRGFEPGLWTGSSSAGHYFHNDHLGTLRQTTDDAGFPEEFVAYTAFGQQKAGAYSPTFGYAGAHGYHRDTASPFLHVGHRYYDPGSGRFIQRDPIGIRGGNNVYAYADNIPTDGVDPMGLSTGLIPGPSKKPWDPFDRQHPSGRAGKGTKNGPLRENLRREKEEAEARARRWDLVDRGLEWVDHPVSRNVAEVADWVSWGCAVPWVRVAKHVPRVFRWARWIKGGVDLWWD